MGSFCQGAASREAPEEALVQRAGEGGGAEEGEQKAVTLVAPLVALRGTPFFEFLEKGHMAVVRGKYFDECLAAGVPFQDRANIPGEAFIDGHEVVELWEEYGYAFLIIISYPWLARGHPDPQCYHLPRLVRALKAFRTYHDIESWGSDAKADRVRELGGGVILDFCTFWQGDNRTAEQKRIFKEGLKLINIPYGHSDVTALKLTSTPATQARRYDDRGWTHFESTVIDGKAPSARSITGERNVLTCDDDFGPEGDADNSVLFGMSKATRKPPLTPLRFREELELRRQRAEAKGEPLFTNGQDSPIILERYDASFEELRRSTKLDYTNCMWGAEEAKELALAVPYFGTLKELRLSENRLHGEAAEALAAALSDLLALETLFLDKNNLGRDAQAFAVFTAALSRCPTLGGLSLNRNELGPEAAAALAEALPNLPALEWLRLGQNHLGRRAQAFAVFTAALSRCPTLGDLWLHRNELGPEAAKALATALPHCPSLRHLTLRQNNMGRDGEAALRAAWLDAGKDEDDLKL